MACIYHTIDTCWELQCTSALSSEMNDSMIAHLLVTMTVLKMPLPWTREMAQQLRALSVPPEITMESEALFWHASIHADRINESKK